MAPAAEEGQSQNAAQLIRFLLFPRSTVSCPLPQELLFHLLVLPLYIINSLEVDEDVVCLYPNTQPTWLQHFCMFVFCLLSFLNLLMPLVKFLGHALMGHKRRHLDRDLNTGELEA
jgi:hypothetical protein